MSTGTVANAGLLKTKYSIPESGKLLLPRRLAGQRLQAAPEHRLTLVTAPAGYGKTTAALEWLSTVSLPHAWLTVDAEDNNAILFWRYFCAALEGICPGICKDVDYVFEAQELFKADMHISILIDRLSGNCQDFLLVLDDLHLVTNAVVLDGLSRLIRYMPGNMHLILLSRTKPRLKLARLKLLDDLVTVGREDLRFDTEEIAQFFKTKGYLLGGNDVQKIESYTEGWAAALVAVALSFHDEKRRRIVMNSFGSCNEQIENYLAEDVFHVWTKDQRDFMEKTAVLDRLCGPLCKAVTGYDGSRMLSELYESNSFLIALDSEGVWFRHHHLFAEFLLKRLKTRDAGMLQGLHFRAGEWFQANGFAGEAIEHFLQAGAYERALPLIEGQASFLSRRREYASLMSWINRLPTEYSGRSLILLMANVSYYYIETNDLQSADRYMAQIELALKEGIFASDRDYTVFLLFKAQLFIIQGEPEKSLQTIQMAAARGIDTVPNKDYFDVNPYDIYLYRCIYHNLFKLFRDKSNIYDAFVVNYRSLINNRPGYAPLLSGEFSYESGRLDEALPKLLAAVDEAGAADCAGAYVPAMITIAKIRRARGDMQGAMAVVEECMRRTEGFHRPHWGYLLRAFRVRLQMDTGDTEAADQWAKESRLTIYQEITAAREYELIVLARVLLLKRRYHDADILLNRLLRFAEEKKRSHSSVEILNLLAIAAYSSLNEEIAAKHLEKAFSIGMAEGYVRSFVDELHPMASLLEMVLREHKMDDRLLVYAKKLQALTNEAIRHAMLPQSRDTAEERLTPMEKRVLRLMLDASTNAEIAAELGVALITVKTHAGSIYKKLGVKNRVQCLKKVGAQLNVR